jgi:hypothetical protein
VCITRCLTDTLTDRRAEALTITRAVASAGHTERNQESRTVGE